MSDSNTPKITDNNRIREKTVIAQISRLRDLSHTFLSHAMSEEGLQGLVPSHGEILMALYVDEALTMQQIAARIKRTKPTTTVLVDKLIALGYVKKQRSQNDGRSFDVTLSRKGRELLPRLGDISDSIHQKIDAILSVQEKKTLSQLMAKLIQNW